VPKHSTFWLTNASRSTPCAGVTYHVPPLVSSRYVGRPLTLRPAFASRPGPLGCRPPVLGCGELHDEVRVGPAGCAAGVVSVGAAGGAGGAAGSGVGAARGAAGWKVEARPPADAGGAGTFGGVRPPRRRYAARFAAKSAQSG